jgi:poly(3-hydroxybutyrate) depolymerase
MVDAGGTSRAYSVWLPSGYDPERRYPVVLLLHGCGSGTNNVPMETRTGGDAIVVRGTGSDDGCWDADPNGADVPYVDAIVADVEQRFCADKSAIFAVGYSSGSWLANQLGCIRSDVYRGLATVAGGKPAGSSCEEGSMAQVFVHDLDDESNLIEWSESARDRLLDINGCDTSLDPVAVDPSPCVSYQGCDPGYPVVWCATSGQGHARQDSLAAPAFWKFFQSLLESP